MSKLVERLASLMDGGGGIFLEPDLAQELLAHIERLEAQLAGPDTTHFDGCHDRGPKHYWCALRKIEQLEANQIPDGCVVVPREPTIDMVEAGAVHVVKGMDYERAKRAWRAMIQAATHGEGKRDE